MSKSNFDELLFKYLTNQTSPVVMASVEELFEALKKRRVVFVTPEGEELLC